MYQDQNFRSGSLMRPDDHLTWGGMMVSGTAATCSKKKKAKTFCFGFFWHLC